MQLQLYLRDSSGNIFPLMSERLDSNAPLPTGETLPNWEIPPVPERAVLNGKYCRLEPLQAIRHAADLHREFSPDAAAKNWTYLPYGPFSTEQSYREWVEEKESLADPLLFAVVPLETETPAGVTGFLRFSPENGCIEIGHIHFAECLKCTPTATEAIALMLRHAFALGYRRCEWKCDSLNAASRRAALRYGFTFEGVFRKHVIYKGRNRDTAWYSIVDTDWEKLVPAFDRWLAPSNFDGNGIQRERLSELTSSALSCE